MNALATGTLVVSALAIAFFALVPRKAGLYRDEHANLAIVAALSSLVGLALRIAGA